MFLIVRMAIIKKDRHSKCRLGCREARHGGSYIYPRTWEAETGRSESKAGLIYKVKFMLARVTQ